MELEIAAACAPPPSGARAIQTGYLGQVERDSKAAQPMTRIRDYTGQDTDPKSAWAGVGIAPVRSGASTDAAATKKERA